MHRASPTEILRGPHLRGVARAARLIVCLAAVAASRSAAAATVRPHRLAERAAAADRVALVRVGASSARLEQGDPRRIRTFTELFVEEDVRGTGPRRVELVQRGGTVGPWTLHAPGDARFSPGERAVVFLSCRTADRCTLVALEAGKLPVEGRDVRVRDLFDGVVRRRELGALLRELRGRVPAGPARTGMPASGAVTASSAASQGRMARHGADGGSAAVTPSSGGSDGVGSAAAGAPRGADPTGPRRLR